MPEQLWAEPSTENAPPSPGLRPSDLLAWVLFGLGFVLFVWGDLGTVGVSGLDLGISAVLMLLGIAFLLGFGSVLVAQSAYRPSAAAPMRAFHISGFQWEEGEHVTLQARRCRRRQAVAVGRMRRLRPVRLVYLFAQRPTLKQVQAQRLVGGKRAQRYLYELEFLCRPEALFERGPVIASSRDLPVLVVRRQAVPPALHHP